MFTVLQLLQSLSREVKEREVMRSRSGCAGFSGQIESKKSPMLVSPETCNITLAAAGQSGLASPRHITHVRRCDADIGQMLNPEVDTKGLESCKSLASSEVLTNSHHVSAP